MKHSKLQAIVSDAADRLEGRYEYVEEWGSACHVYFGDNHAEVSLFRDGQEVNVLVGSAYAEIDLEDRKVLLGSYPIEPSAFFRTNLSALHEAVEAILQAMNYAGVWGE